jgi:hypothetical protein
VSATPKHRRNEVERAPTDAASRSSRVPPVSSSATPIYDDLLREMFPDWPDHDPDPPTEQFPTVQFSDEWFDELPEIAHNAAPDGNLFQSAVVGDR